MQSTGKVKYGIFNWRNTRSSIRRFLRWTVEEERVRIEMSVEQDSDGVPQTDSMIYVYGTSTCSNPLHPSLTVESVASTRLPDVLTSSDFSRLTRMVSQSRNVISLS